MHRLHDYDSRGADRPLQWKMLGTGGGPCTDCTSTPSMAQMAKPPVLDGWKGIMHRLHNHTFHDPDGHPSMLYTTRKTKETIKTTRQYWPLVAKMLAEVNGA
jgi:hypothetical protein